MSKEDMDDLLTKYLGDYVQGNVNKEFEIRFSTLHTKSPIRKEDFMNVCQRLKSSNFDCVNPNGNYYLRIQNTYMNREGREVLSNIRFELNGLHIIRDYCLYENIIRLIDKEQFNGEMNYIKKDRVKMPNGEYLKPVNNDDYQFRTSYQHEASFNPESNLVKNITQNWDNSKKLYRYINRIELKHPDYPVLFHLSIVKTNKKNKYERMPKLVYNIQEASLFKNAESYEIELELDNERIENEEKWRNKDVLKDAIKKCIKIVLCGLQKTNYPITLNNKNTVFSNYLELIYGKDNDERLAIKHFIGPSNLTLQQKNIIDLENNDMKHNIRNNYTVTDKADGERYMLYIASDGKMYLIDMNMNIIFTGMLTKDKVYFNSILDGEYIINDKYGNTINMFACFDIYFLNKEDVRSNEFANINKIETTEFDKSTQKKKQYRLDILKDVVSTMKVSSITKKKTKSFMLEVKHFEIGYNNNIFDATQKINEKVKDPSFMYNTDGFIYTPASDAIPDKKYKFTWDRVFKWKPPEFNTIDFLVSINKNKDGTEELTYHYENGKDVSSDSIIQYKTLTLMCGFNPKDHGYINPCSQVMNESYNKAQKGFDKYGPMPFYPSDPYDDTAHLCNIILKQDENNVLQMFSEEGEVIEDNMIVEFKYDINEKHTWKWKPLRVRYDKTAQFRSGIPNYGNAYHVANSNWYSIHNPITLDMITTGRNIPADIALDDVYYNRIQNKTFTRGMRDFHNLVVKRMLITNVSKRNDTLIDLAVGKGGDFPKWIASKLKFIYGIDKSKDNIENKLDGACARYLNYIKDGKSIPKCLFVHGDSSKSILSNDAFDSDVYKNVNQALMGKGPKDEKVLGSGVYKQYGVASDGFQICSCQFALHYFFENLNILEQFLKNVAYTTKVGGYFIGTCYDGKTMFNKLEEKQKDESMTIFNTSGEAKVWEVIKRYNFEDFNNDSSCVGYAIDVYQDSINQVFREYLVNFDYLDRIMENFGFIPIEQDEADKMNLPEPNGMFKSLYKKMEADIKSKKLNEKDIGSSLRMNDYEKEISFLNRYFVYKKIRSVPKEDQVIHEDESVTEEKEHGVGKILVKTDEKIVLYKYEV
tara:strand:+ start:1381 stop:4674 length:3294 start_codon:yes stop_codon:yes gene_type:complete